MLKIRSGPAALAVSTLALVIAMGGTGYAQIHDNGSRQASQSARTAPAARHAWHNLKLTGGWAFGRFSSDRVAYYKDSLGVVHLRGSAVGGSTSAVAFRLPVGARPSHNLWLSIYAANGASGGLKITPNGQATLFDNSGGSAATVWSSLDGVSFPVP